MQLCRAGRFQGQMWSAMLYCLVMCTYKGFFFPGTQSLHCRKKCIKCILRHSNTAAFNRSLLRLDPPEGRGVSSRGRSHKHLFLSFFFLFFFLAQMTERKSFLKIFYSWHCQLRLRRVGTEVQRLWASECEEKWRWTRTKTPEGHRTNILTFSLKYHISNWKLQFLSWRLQSVYF